MRYCKVTRLIIWCMSFWEERQIVPNNQWRALRAKRRKIKNISMWVWILIKPHRIKCLNNHLVTSGFFVKTCGGQIIYCIKLSNVFLYFFRINNRNCYGSSLGAPLPPSFSPARLRRSIKGPLHSHHSRAVQGYSGDVGRKNGVAVAGKCSK